MNSHRRPSYLNERANQNQNQNPRFLKGDRYNHYSDPEHAHEDFHGNYTDTYAVHPRENGSRIHPFSGYTPGADYEESTSSPSKEPWTQRESRSRDGMHAGKGPKAYQRTDERIREDVCEALTNDSHVDASDIDVRVENGMVFLSGTVSNRRMKRMAEDCIDAISGIHDILNELRVAPMGASEEDTKSPIAGKSKVEKMPNEKKIM